MAKRIYVGWIARNNDNRVSQGDCGPTTMFLTDKGSMFASTPFDCIYLLHQRDDVSDMVRESVIQRLRERNVHASIGEFEPYSGRVTDHQKIKLYLERFFHRVGQDFPDAEIIIHISPGTPAMHAVWLLMASSGLIRQICGPRSSVRLAESIRPDYQTDDAAVREIQIDFDGFYNKFAEVRGFAKDGYGSLDDEVIDSVSVDRYSSPVMRAFLHQVELASSLHHEPLLLLGERGTGKTVFASYIRELGLKKRGQGFRKPLKTFSCGQFDQSFMRAELFGYEKGAFTGAVQKQVGLCAEADKDVLFLDEIHNLATDAQNMLIRAVEEKSFLPLGSSKVVSSDFRLISATNLDFEKLTEYLRQDFLDRISLLTLHVPALREIPEDHELIWQQVWQSVTRRNRFSHLEVPSSWKYELLERLRMHPLPGNIRDLQRVAVAALMYWNIAQGSCRLGPAEVVEYALDSKKKKVSLSRQKLRPEEKIISLPGRLVSIDWGAIGYVRSKELLKMARREIFEHIKSELNTGRPLRDITDMSRRTFNNWKHDIDD